jgi:rfaE bifunctional protein kinase chain/domain
VKPLTAERARGLLAAMRGKRVLVLGDVMLDEFLWGRVARISPEAPVPVVEVSRHSFHVGGAGNVAGNVRSLGGEATVVGLIGRDVAGDRVREALRSAGVEEALTLADGGRPTTVKTRIIAHHQQVVRADREVSDDATAELQDALFERVREALPGCHALVLSDYQKGVLTAGLMKRVLPVARRRGLPILVDPKVRHFPLYRGVTLLKPNLKALEEASGRPLRAQRDLVTGGDALLRRLRCQALLVTRGEEGMTLFRAAGRPLHIPTAAREVFDVTGAGDTVMATLALALCAGAALPEAAMLANHAAGVVVGKLGTATVTSEEVLGALTAQAPP